jgi:hypothetical protein
MIQFHRNGSCFKLAAMSRRRKDVPVPPSRPATREVTDAEIDDTIAWAMESADKSNAAMHELFNKHVRDVMEDAGLTEEEKQTVLVAMACPCCGSGTASFTYKLRPKA